MKFFSNIMGKLQALSKAQKILTAAIAATSLAVAGGGAVLVSTSAGGNAASVEETLESETEVVEMEETESETETVPDIEVKLETVSIEKDLKIKVVDENGDLVTDVAFDFAVAQLSVDDEEDEQSIAEEIKTEAVDLNIEDYDYENYLDDDKDGIVHIINLKGGEFLIHVNEVEGYVFEADTVKTRVKGKLEYKKVDVSNEVKTEAQVNTTVEDTAQNNVVVESVIVDTLPFLASTTTASEVGKDQVDTTGFPSASKGVDTTWTFKVDLTRTCTEHITVETKQNEVAATCTTPGSYTKVVSCSRCQTEISRETIEVEAKGHKGGTPVEENRVEAQIGVAGSYDSVVYCTECSVEVSREKKEIPALAEPDSTETPETSTGDQNQDVVQPETPESTETPVSTETPESTEAPASTEVPESTEAPVSSEVPTSTEAIQETNLDVTAKRHMGHAVVTTAGEFSIDAQAAVPAKGTYKETLSATIVLPFDIKLYRWNEENSQAVLSLAITDEHGIIDKENISYSVNHTAIVSCERDSADPSKALVKGLAAGTANIQITIPTWTDESKTTKKYDTLSCTVMVDDYSGDTSVQLKDKSGNPLYADANCTKPATAKEYSDPNAKIYGQPKYTGWQTLNGSLYYYKEDNTPATGEQTIGGVKYSFSADGVLQTGNQLLGIDVSKWQGNIDWTAVANSGVKFAIIRCAYRGASTGVIVEDPYFRQNIQGATANGIKVGVYFFTQAINEYEAVEEASTAIGLVAGYHLNYPIFIDTENATNGRANGLDVATRTAVVRAFCETVRNAGYKPGIYASRSWYTSKLDMSQLSAYNIWVAQYNTTCTYTGKYDIWQYTSTGSIPGIKGNVDLNVGYTSY